MPTTATPAAIPVLPDGVRQNTRILDRLLGLVHDAAHAAADAVTTRDRARTIVQALEARHPDYTQISLRSVARYAFVLLALPAAVILDYFLDAPTITYAVKAGGLGPEAIQWARLGVPCVIVAMEGALNTAIHHARDRWQDGETGVGPYAIWFTLSLGAAVALTALVGASNLPHGAFRLDNSMLLLGVCALSGLTHLAVLYGPLFDAKGYLLFVTKRGHHNVQGATADRASLRNGRQATERFGRYVRTADAHNRAFPAHPHTLGPFDRVTRDIINDRMGMRVIYGDAVNQTPPAPAGQAAPPANPPVGGEATTKVPQQPAPPVAAPPAAAAVRNDDQDAELQYLREVLRQRQRDDESAVTV